MVLLGPMDDGVSRLGDLNPNSKPKSDPTSNLTPCFFSSLPR